MNTILNICDDENSNEQQVLNSEMAIALFLKASIDCEEAQDRNNKRKTTMKTYAARKSTRDKNIPSRRLFLGAAAPSITGSTIHFSSLVAADVKAQTDRVLQDVKTILEDQ